MGESSILDDIRPICEANISISNCIIYVDWLKNKQLDSSNRREDGEKEPTDQQIQGGGGEERQTRIIMREKESYLK